MNEEIQTGALLDERPKVQKEKDFIHEEIFASAGEPVTWEEKSVYKEYFPYKQSSSLSCVSGGGAITEEFFSTSEGQKFIPSRKDIYIRRKNYPGGGMAMADLFDICTKGGIASEDEVVSQGLNEAMMNAKYSVTDEVLKTRLKHRFKNWVTIKDFDNEETLANIVDHVPIVAFWFFDNNQPFDEWWRQYPKIVNNNLDLYDSNAAHHQAAIVDRTLKDGKKFFVIQDTAGTNYGLGDNKNLRLVDMAFIKKRLYAAGYGINSLDVSSVSKPIGKWERILQVGVSGDDVKQLQAVLIYEKLLPIKTPTGYYGGLTMKAVSDYQVRYTKDILAPKGLTKPTGVVGPSTLAHLNKNYGIIQGMSPSTLSKIMEGKKTYTGIIVALIGVFGLAGFVTPEETAQIVDFLLQLAGLALAIYGRAAANKS